MDDGGYAARVPMSWHYTTTVIAAQGIQIRIRMSNRTHEAAHLDRRLRTNALEHNIETLGIPNMNTTSEKRFRFANSRQEG